MATLGKTGCGKFVFDRYGSHIDIPSVVLKEGLLKLRVPDERKYLYSSVMFSQNVGYNTVVPTNKGEDIFFAKRPGNNFLSRFVKKEPIPTRYVSLELMQLDGISNELVLLNSHFGDIRFPEINFSSDSEPMEEDFNYWNSHAFCWGYLAVVPGTITEACPWEP